MTKTLDSTLGFVADHCPFCPGLRAFRLTHAENRYRITCTTCQSELQADLRTYASVRRERGEDLGELMRETFPNFHEFYRDRLAFEENGLAPGATRRKLVTETLQLLAPEARGWRFLNRTLVTRLSRALKPLKPTELELAGVLQDFKKAGLKIGRGVDAAEVVRAMRN